MGSGKSLLGPKIARRLNIGFIDLDHYIEARYGEKIEEIFVAGNEDLFRHAEKECLTEVSQIDNVLVATGGGTPCFFDNFKIIKNSGISIYFRISPGVLTSRLFNNRDKRPLLSGIITKESMNDFINKTLAEREKYYKKADVIIELEDLKLPIIITKIKQFTAL